MEQIICKKRVYFHTNVVVPYRYRQFRQISESFPNSLFVLNGEMDNKGDTAWGKGDEDRLGIRYVRIAAQNTDTAGKGRAFFSPRLLWLILTQPWGSVHVMGAGLSGLNKKMLFLSGLLGHSKLIWWSDGCTKEEAETTNPSWKRRWLVRYVVKGMFVCFGWGKIRAQRYGFSEKNIINQYFSCDDEKYDVYMKNRHDAERKRMRCILGMDSSSVSILNVARHLEWKRLRDLAQAFTILERDCPDIAAKCHLVMIGGGMENCHSEVLRRLKLVTVHEFPPMPADNVMAYYAASDIFAFPSEGDIWGVVVNEAMSMGLPVICTDVIGAAELVEDGKNGFIVPPRRPDLIAERIKVLADDGELCSKMGDAALERMRHWTTAMGVADLARWIIKADRND